MPYIKPEQRSQLDDDILKLAATLTGHAGQDGDINPGVVNYTITKLLLNLKNKQNYKNYNAIVGALECCKLEFYRRAIAAYEDEKIKENGDVY